MIRVTICNNMKRDTVFVEETDTIRQCLEDNHADYARAALHLDSAPIGGSELDKTFAELGYTGEEGHDRAFLMMVVKADNAMI